MKKNNNYKTLVERYLYKEADKRELAVFFKLLSESKLDFHLKSQMDLDLVEPAAKKVPFFKTYYGSISAASILLLIITTTSLFYLNRNRTPNIAYDLIAPGSNQVVLILSNGQEVSLAENANKTISEGDIDIFIKENNIIVYGSSKLDITNKDSGLKSRHNTIKTSYGGNYQVQLADGSKVWLNSLSSITFPLEFDSKKRVVSMKGEVYFNILHANSIPFIVSHKAQEISVFGTQFNVNAYENESAIRTTLIEGSISVKTAVSQVQLVPGEQSVIKSGNNQIEILKIDLTENDAIAWKEGYIRFDRADLETIIRQISRWHDLQVVYGSKTSNDVFTGRIKRSEKIEAVVDILNMGGIKVRLECKTLYVGC